MQIVIDIPDQMYQKIKETNMVISGRRSGKRFDYILFNAVNAGTPLPKGHGDLIDRKELLKQPMDTANYPSNYVRIAETIIEADKEYEAEVITRGNCMLCGKELTEGLFFCKECEDKEVKE